MTKILSILILLLSGLTISAPQSLAQPEAVFTRYLSALKAGEWEAADSCWHPEQVCAARRLGIAYEGIQTKYDCASEVIGALDYIRRGEVKVSIGDLLDRGEWVELRVILAGLEDSVTVPYYLVPYDREWRLSSMTFIVARRWPVRETRFARVFCSDSTRINGRALRELDEFVASMGRILDIPAERMERLAAEKIDYYLCDDDAMDRLVDPAAQGMADLQFDALITRHLPHKHELAHLMVNYALDSLPLFTIPCLQEGAAVCLGGRWGKSPEVVFLLGRFALAEEFANLADILTFAGFHFEVGAPDLSYAASGLLCRFLIEEFGIGCFKRLYRELSGASATVRTMSQSRVQETIVGVCGLSWTEIERRFADFWPQFEYAGLYPGIPPDRGAGLCRVASPKLSATIHASASHYSFEIEAGGSQPNGVIIIADSAASVERSYQSRLFSRHFPRADYQGERYGIWFTDQEAGLYDYQTNTLMAKHVRSFSPGTEYWDPEKLIIRFYLDKNLVAGNAEEIHFRMAER